MDNTHLPPGGDEQGSRPTEQFWTSPGQPGNPGQGPGGHGYGPGPGGPGGAGHGGSAYGGPGQAGPGYGGPGPGGPGPGGPGQQGMPGWEQPGPAGLQQHYSRDRRKALHWSIGIAAAALLVGGGAIAGVSLAGHSSQASPAALSAPAPGGSGQAAGQASPAGQAAVLNAALSSADSAGAPGYLDSTGAVSSAGSPSGRGTGGVAAVAGARARRCARARTAARAAGRPRLARAIRRFCRHPVLRRLALRGVHGEFTLRGKNGYKDLAFERGTIESVSSGHDIVVRAPDGTTWTWNLVPDTVVRRSGSKTSQSALAAGGQVWVGGPVSQGTKDARLIVVRPQAASQSPSPSSS